MLGAVEGIEIGRDANLLAVGATRRMLASPKAPALLPACGRIRDIFIADNLLAQTAYLVAAELSDPVCLLLYKACHALSRCLPAILIVETGMDSDILQGQLR